MKSVKTGSFISYLWTSLTRLLQQQCVSAAIVAVLLHQAFVQVYATSMAMVVTMLVSMGLFALVPSLQMLLGIATASMSLVLYYLPPRILLGEQQESSSSNSKASLLPR